MHIAVIADIHGNAQALRAVLRDIQAQGVDALYVNGDVVNRGPDSVEALQTLLELPTRPSFVLGNHDDLMKLWLEQNVALPTDWFSDPFWAATEWSARRLQAAGLLPEIASWPMTARIAGAEYGVPQAGDILLAHGTPAHYRESLGRSTTDERVHELLEGGVSVLVGSHTHWPMLREMGSKLIVNTGSVGAPFNEDPRAQYLLLSLTGEQWQARLRAVEYDRQPTLQRYSTSGLLAAGGVSAQIFYEELKVARSLYTPYWLWTEEEKLPRNAGSWAQFRALNPEKFAAL